MYVSMKEIVDAAYAGKYGVPAVPGFNEFLVRAAVEAALEARSPLIFLAGNWGEPEFTHGIVRYFAEKADVPVALCLDHSPTFEDCVVGIRTGCTAIMADRSRLPYDENVAQVKLLADIAHAAGVSVEAEIGHVGRGDNYAVDGVTGLTDPETAKRYAGETGVDCLAVAVGTAHGVYTGAPKIDFERLKAIDAACRIPLVLHGGSGSGDDNIRRACAMGIAKVNIVTEIVIAACQAAQAGDFEGNKAHGMFPAISGAIKKSVLRLFEVTGSAGKAGALKASAGGASRVAADAKSTEEM